MCNFKKKNKHTNKQTTRNKKTSSTYQRTLASKDVVRFFCHIIYDKTTLFVSFQSNLQQVLGQCRQAKKRARREKARE